jgi:hypothetical protein
LLRIGDIEVERATGSAMIEEEYNVHENSSLLKGSRLGYTLVGTH